MQTKLSLFLAAAATLAACGSRPLVGTTPHGGAAGAGGVEVPAPLRISGVEAVTRIAAVVWRATPDGDVLTEAEKGRFTTGAELAPVVREMLADPRAAVGVGAFYRWWLDLDRIAMNEKDPAVFPMFTPALRADVAKETETFGVQLTLALNESYTTLMTAPYSFINARLADVYGVAGVTGDDLRQVNLDSSQRAGILTQPALQVVDSYSTRNSPTVRGKVLVEQVFCGEIPDPPPSSPSLEPLLAPGVTVRKALEKDLQQEASCALCHSLFDPHGLEFEAYDSVGRWRTVDSGAPVDLSNLSIYDTGEIDGRLVALEGPVAYAKYAASSETARTCFAKQWLAFSRGAPDYTVAAYSLTNQDVAAIYPKFRDSAFNLQELIVAVLTSDAFLTPR